MRVCQLAFEQMTTAAEVPYHAKPSAKYQGQVLPEESRILVDPEFRKHNPVQQQESTSPTEHVQKTT